MTAYAQHMKHWKNHRKDRYTQQCVPLINTTSGGKADYIVLVNGESYLVTAYCMENAIDLARKQNPGADIKPGGEARTDD